MSNNFNYVLHIFPGEATNFAGGASPPWLRACTRLYLFSGTPENGIIALLHFQQGLIKIDFKQIYCNYSRTPKIHGSFL